MAALKGDAMKLLTVACVLVLGIGCSRESDTKLRERWTKVEALHLPEATLDEIVAVLGPYDETADAGDATMYAWYRVNWFAKGRRQSCHLLQIAVDNAPLKGDTNTMTFFRRIRPVVSENAQNPVIDFDAGYRDAKRKWKSELPPGLRQYE